MMDVGEGALAFWLLLPTALLLALIIIYPVCRLIYTSFLSLSLTSGLPAAFAGLQNYRDMLADPVFWSSLWNTVLITVVTVPGALVVGMALALRRQSSVPPEMARAPCAAAAVGAAARLLRPDIRLVLPLRLRHRQRHPAPLGLPTVIWFNSAARAMVGDLPDDRLEVLVVHGADHPGRAADDPALALRGGRNRRGRRASASSGDHAAAADAGDRRGADLPHDHRAADVRHSLHDDPRRTRHLDRNARHAHPPEHDRLPRPRLWLGAGRRDVRPVDGASRRSTSA